MTQKNSLFLIVNPNAGQKNFKRSWQSIQNILNSKNIDFSFEFTKQQKDEISLVDKAVQKGFRNIIVVGGDGTLHHTVNGIMGQRYIKSSDIKLGIIPLGTGNDWVRTYHIPNSIEESIDIILNNETDFQDIGKIIYSNGKEEYYNNLAGIGYDGYVVNKLNSLKRFGSIAYLLSGLQGLLFYKKNRFQIKFNNHQVEEKCLMILFGICQYSGGGMQMTKESNPKDGFLDLTIAKNFSFFDLVLNLPGLYNGNIVNHKKVETHKVTSVEIEELSSTASYIEADGELIGKGSLKVSLIPEAIQFFNKS